ncbi:MAG: TerB family tellurite resistance protein [Nonlabens sp.]|uniref:TerB family tellurite resistance protein n=1 Tax=Nonlabens sp. TaxID=1888209 RepID=UPI003EF42053
MSDFTSISSKEHSKRFAHFSSLVYMAQSDGVIDENEKAFLKPIAVKLGITEEEYNQLIQEPKKYPVEKTSDINKRLRRLFEMFQVIYANGIQDDLQRGIVYEYALELGFSKQYAEKVVDKSISLFSGQFTFHDYHSVISKE